MHTSLARRLVLVCLLTVGTVIAHASVTEIQYTFFAQLVGNNSQSAQLIVPNFVTSLVTIPASQLESCQFEGQPCSGVTLIPNSFLPDIGVRKDVFLVDAGLNPGPGLRFQQGAFDAPGVYFDLSNTALLSVKTLTFTPSSEPSTMLLTGSGVLAVALIIRGKLGIQQ